MWEQVVQSSGRDIGDIQNLTGQYPEQPALCDPALRVT